MKHVFFALLMLDITIATANEIKHPRHHLPRGSMIARKVTCAPEEAKGFPEIQYMTCVELENVK